LEIKPLGDNRNSSKYLNCNHALCLLALHHSNFNTALELCATFWPTQLGHILSPFCIWKDYRGAFMATTGKGKKKNMIKKQMFGGSLDKNNPIPPPLTSLFLLTLCQQLPHPTCPGG